MQPLTGTLKPHTMLHIIYAQPQSIPNAHYSQPCDLALYGGTPPGASNSSSVYIVVWDLPWVP